MAQQSRRARYHAQTKRENTLLKRANFALQSDKMKVLSTLLAVLSQVGGEVVITPATLEHFAAHLAELGFAGHPNSDGSLTISLVSQASDAPTPEAPVDPPLVTLAS